MPDNKNKEFSWEESAKKFLDKSGVENYDFDSDPFGDSGFSDYGSGLGAFADSDSYIYSPSGVKNTSDREAPRKKPVSGQHPQQRPPQKQNQRSSATGNTRRTSPQGGQKGAKATAPKNSSRQINADRNGRGQSRVQTAEIGRGGNIAGPDSRGTSQGKSASVNGGKAVQRPQGKKAAAQTNRKNSRAKLSEREKKALKRKNKRENSYEAEYKRLVETGDMSQNEAMAYIAAKIKRKKYIRIGLSIAGVLAGVAVAVIIFCFVKGFPILTLEVEGNTVYKASEILTSANISQGDNMLLIRQKKTDKILSRNLPYIKSVKVDYVLPDKLILHITETKDRYFIVADNSYVCLDEDNKVVSLSKKKLKDGVYKLIGLEKEEVTEGSYYSPSEKNGNKEKFEFAKTFAKAAESAGVKNCSVIDFTNTNEIKVTCNGIMTFIVDYKTPVERRLLIAKEELELRLSANRASTFDLRFSDQVVVRDGNE